MDKYSEKLNQFDNLTFELEDFYKKLSGGITIRAILEDLSLHIKMLNTALDEWLRSVKTDYERNELDFDDYMQLCKVYRRYKKSDINELLDTIVIFKEDPYSDE